MKSTTNSTQAFSLNSIQKYEHLKGKSARKQFSLHSQRLYARPRFVFPRNLSFPLPTSARTCTTTSSTDRRQTDLRSYRALTEVRRHAAKRPTSEQTRRPQPHGRCRSLFICFAVFCSVLSPPCSAFTAATHHRRSNVFFLLVFAAFSVFLFHSAFVIGAALLFP